MSSLCLVVRVDRLKKEKTRIELFINVDIAWILNNTTKQRLNTKPCEASIVSHAKGMAIAQGFSLVCEKTLRL